MNINLLLAYIFALVIVKFLVYTMKFIGYLKNSLKDFFISSGFLMILITTISAIYSKETIETSQLFQIMLFSLAYVFFKLAFINKNDINKKVRLITFNVFLTLSELMILLWMLFFSQGKVMKLKLYTNPSQRDLNRKLMPNND